MGIYSNKYYDFIESCAKPQTLFCDFDKLLRITKSVGKLLIHILFVDGVRKVAIQKTFISQRQS